MVVWQCIITCGFDCLEVYKCVTVEMDKPLIFGCMAVGRLWGGCKKVTVAVAVEKLLTFVDGYQ